ncbi:ferredoxin family protein [Tepidibacillus sp. LV47]|uniref:ferredoxin family protein n=1 Tax=Tepidibacillus sp. LV47 TaxID=3398228 RepID=UPI003AAFA6FA
MEGDEIMAQPLKKVKVDDLQYLTRFVSDKESHLVIKDHNICKTKCKEKYCTFFCPGEVYKWEGERMFVGFEGCHECGSCRIGCPYDNIEWKYPKGGLGVVFRLA